MTQSPHRAARAHKYLEWSALPAIALVIWLFDQYTKHLVVSSMEPFEMRPLSPSLGHIFTLTYVRNTGAAFGIFPNASTLFVIIALVVVLGIAVYFRQLPDDEWLLKMSLAMQLGGALGNLTDRLRLGYVVDFMDFRMWPVFNFADTFIVVGVALLGYRLLLHPRPFPMLEEDAENTPAGREEK